MSRLQANGPFPEQFGRYEVRGWLGGGSMADVYRAHDTVLRRDVALKVPQPRLMARSRLREQFLHEAQAMAHLDHPNICKVFDHGTIDSTPFLSMELIPGVRLCDYRPADRPRLEPAAVVELAHTLALALAVMHGQGIIHRDLKPRNILMTPGGPDSKPVITDFGLALQLNRAEALLPQPGDFFGTIAYMAPEQIQGGLEPLGPGCDIYALGVILYQLLTGRLPFQGRDRASQIEQILRGQPVRPSHGRPDISPALDALCLRALALSVRDRFLCMEDFASVLAPVVAETCLVPAAPSSSVPAPRPRPRVDRQACHPAFVGYGTSAPPSDAFRDRLYLDVGNALRPGVIDHHHLMMSTASSTRLVLNRPDLIEAIVAPGRRPEDRFTLVLHESPDLDSIAAAFLAVEYLAAAAFPEGADLLARYVDQVEEGWPGMILANPFTLYAAQQCLVNRPADNAVTNEERWQQAVRDGLRVVRYVLDQVVATGRPLPEVDAFACPGLFSEEDRRLIRDDIVRYERKLAEPRCRARTARVRLPGRLGGTEAVEALLVRDVQNEDDPEHVLFFKDWARSDARRCANGKGFEALSVFMSAGQRQKRSCILSVTPDSRVSLRGLGERLDEAEARRRTAIFGCDDRVMDPVTGVALPRRPGYANADPWYDGRAHGFTIVDAPRDGTVLTVDEIEAEFLELGGCPVPPQPLAECGG